LPRPNIAWLSDGSMPIVHSIMPAKLAENEPFSRYEPRGYSHLPIALVIKKHALRSALGVELNRLECTAELAQRKEYEWIAVQLSIFDDIAHLFGHNWLDEKDLWLHPLLDEFLELADEKLATICDGANNFIFSAFSHCPCIATINMSLLLREGGFLSLH